MRADMFKVIVERPRLGGKRARKGRRPRDADDYPKQMGMGRGRKIAGDWKMLNENLSPLRRFLEKQVGRPWNKIYSEICEHLRVTHTVQQHVRGHLKDFVAFDPRPYVFSVYEIDPMSMPRLARRRVEMIWSQPLYVDPRDGILKRSEWHPYVKRKRRESRKVRLRTRRTGH
jgi:hypothetical protein